mmetsp:Transcript_71177/g.231208  ORF Transcript_71177/g.231208 Transcript_71177/m.231208 type:complete len:230 (-) Transcript_71177:1-690(-)
MERPDVDDQETEECSEQVWNRREAARSRQIAIGKNRPEYKRYAQEVGNLRDSSMPSTPDPRSRVSKRQFDRALSDWRRRLHEYDASGTPLHSCSSSPQGFLSLPISSGAHGGGCVTGHCMIAAFSPVNLGSVGHLLEDTTPDCGHSLTGRRRGGKGVVRLRLADRLPEPRRPSTVAPCTQQQQLLRLGPRPPCRSQLRIPSPPHRDCDPSRTVIASMIQRLRRGLPTPK